MAEWDDERPDFDAAFRDEPEDAGRAGRRRGRQSRRAAEPDDAGSTGEIPRARVSEGSSSGGGRTSGARAGAGRATARARAAARGARGGGGARRGGGRGPSGGGVAVLQGPRGRLILGIAFAVILVIVIALVVKDCQRDQLEDSYTEYINGVAAAVSTSAEQGAALRQVMANPRGERPPELRQKIQDIANQAQGTLDEVENLDPPGALSAPQNNLVLALQYRVTGLNTLAKNLPTLLQSTDVQTKASGIAGIMKLFQASDVIYDTSFNEPAKRALEDDDITGIEVPQLQAFLPNAALTTVEGARTLLPDLQRRTQATGGSGGDAESSGNLRGTSLESTVALPSETRLTPGTTAAVQQTEMLKWAVTVMNSGDFDETNVVVRATFFYSSDPQDTDVREVPIENIASGESITVEIDGPGSDKVVFGDQGTLRIEVEPVTGETRIDNNRVEYPVKITI
ncbi:hypothetical protein [Miltoncostaea oceani]|uniref:hypothetical protein n=1 Tax=Miltoncostaea oceani TaxID=2843216 RepID=UPI001C3E0ECC|nr:hypothetical protein [Miltoncostaea oceani]